MTLASNSLANNQISAANENNNKMKFQDQDHLKSKLSLQNSTTKSKLQLQTTRSLIPIAWRSNSKSTNANANKNTDSMMNICNGIGQTSARNEFRLETKRRSLSLLSSPCQSASELVGAATDNARRRILGKLVQKQANVESSKANEAIVKLSQSYDDLSKLTNGNTKVEWPQTTKSKQPDQSRLSLINVTINDAIDEDEQLQMQMQQKVNSQKTTTSTEKLDESQESIRKKINDNEEEEEEENNNDSCSSSRSINGETMVVR